MTGERQPPHILAMNDSPDVMDLFRDLLTEEGYRVTTLTYATHDLDTIAALRPDLIILDYMWGGDDLGWSLLQMLRLNPSTRATPIVLCTGALRQVTDLKAHLDEMDVRVVIKPFDIDELVRVVRDLLSLADIRRNAATRNGDLPEQDGDPLADAQ